LKFEDRIYEKPYVNGKFNLLNLEYTNSLPTIINKYYFENCRHFFTFSKFLLDHKSTKVVSYDQVLFLLSNGKSFNAWSSSVKAEWELMHSVPEWVGDDSEMKKYWELEFQSHLIKLGGHSKTRDMALKEAEAVYKKSVSTANEIYKQKELEICSNAPGLLIHRISSDSLPEHHLLDIMAISNKKERTEAKKKYLNQYRLELLKKFQKGDISLESLIDLVK
jgi:hypothetical protein